MFIELVVFLVFVGLMDQGCVKSRIPMAVSNTINTTNPMNTTNKYVGSEGEIKTLCCHLLRVISSNLLRVIYRGYPL